MTTADHALLDARDAARQLVRSPLVLAERDPDLFSTIRRHEQLLDRWFTQRFGYRLQVESDTVRLVKSSVVARSRPLMTATSTPRPFSQREYVILALALAAVVAGPNVISLRDLVLEVRSAAIDADVEFTEDAADRRAVVIALRWMIEHGVATELHDRVDRYASDDAADAVIRIRPDRIAMLTLPSLVGAETAEDVLDRSGRREQSRQWMRSLLLEEPVLYRDDVTDGEWAELRRRLGEESAWFDEMFGVEIEARAEGVAVIDPDGRLTDVRFPTTGTVGHAALLLIDELHRFGHDVFTRDVVIGAIRTLVERYGSYWSNLSDDPPALADAAVGLLVDVRLARSAPDGSVEILPAAWRFRAEARVEQQVLL
ncbi:MAG: TIGR02678 family protein [Acidimicrobiaceae bacterium]|nr:TIGR02678 family protein [Acidimicrobiaceae bacterium]